MSFWLEQEMRSRLPPQTEERAGWDRFGFLQSDVSGNFEGGAIDPVANYQEVTGWVQEHLHYVNLAARPREGFEPGILFPPHAWREVRDPQTDEAIGVVPGSERPPLLQSVPASHHIRLDGVIDPRTEREAATGFLTKLIGFLYDAPMQFCDWWFDGPVAIGGSSLDPAPQVLEHFVSHAFAAWQSWHPECQQLIISLLKMHGRAPAYGWYWERFSWEYTVTDCCYRIADSLWPGRFRRNAKPHGKRPNHAERIQLMAREFGLRFDDEEDAWVNLAVCLRNELIHEARWCRTQPSTKGTDASFHAPYIMHKLNQRLIVALLDYHNGFLGSGWITWTNACFDRMR